MGGAGRGRSLSEPLDVLVISTCVTGFKFCNMWLKHQPGRLEPSGQPDVEDLLHQLDPDVETDPVSFEADDVQTREIFTSNIHLHSANL